MKNWFLFFIVWFLGLRIIGSGIAAMEPGFASFLTGKSELISSVAGVAHLQASLPVTPPPKLNYLASLAEPTDEIWKLWKEPILLTVVSFASVLYVIKTSGLTSAIRSVSAVPLYVKVPRTAIVSLISIF